MIRTAIKENYGTPLMDKLVSEATSIGVRLSYWKDMDRKYIVIFNSMEYVMPKGISASACCWFMRGLVEMAKSQLASRRPI